MTRSRHTRRRRPRIHRRTPPGASPGTIVAPPNAPRPIIRVIAYGSDAVEEREIKDLAEIKTWLTRWPVTWINVDGLGDAATIARLGEIFGLHSLALEDVVNVHQRAKLEDYGDHLFIVARMAHDGEKIETEQVSLFVGRNYVISFQERGGDCLDPVRHRIRTHKGKIRGVGSDYLAYAILDAIIDAYFPVLEEFSERLDALEDRVLDHRDPDASGHLHAIKHDLLMLRRAVWPHRDVMNALTRDDNPLIRSETRVFLRDCYDHVVQLMDLVETYREVGSDLRDAYLSALSNRLNETMQVLTVIATLFIPLTFIVGVYGMNFDYEASPWNMPELKLYYGYPAIWLVMLAIAAGQLYFFWRKGMLRPALRIRREEVAHPLARNPKD